MGTCSSVLLLSLIEDILDLSKMEAGTFKINKGYMVIPELVDEVGDIFSTQCKQRNIELLIEVESCLSNIRFHSDRSRLKQILLNLLSNSSKFTFEGHIKLSVKVIQRNREYFVEFWVSDTGTGIKLESQDKLFKLFSMISETSSLNPNGTGIGLTVTKKYVIALGGEINLESEFGIGTSVTFILPLHLDFESNNEIDTLDIPTEKSPVPVHDHQMVDPIYKFEKDNCKRIWYHYQ